MLDVRPVCAVTIGVRVRKRQNEIDAINSCDLPELAGRNSINAAGPAALLAKHRRDSSDETISKHTPHSRAHSITI